MSAPIRTYGTLSLHGNVVEIDCEAHVRVLLKRVCTGLQQRQGALQLHGTLTDALAKDLEWIQQRYPLAQRAATQIEVRAAAHRFDAVRDRSARIIAKHRSDHVPKLAIAARDYQTVAAELAYTRKGLLLADDLGVGKTASGIGLLAYPDTLPAVVVLPTHLQGQWKRELGRFAPWLSVHTVAKREVADVTADVLLITYAKLDAWQDALCGQVRTAIFDEVQELRSGPGTNKYAAAQRVSNAAHWRMGLSATPIHNYGIEFFHVMSILQPELLGSAEEFVAEWCYRIGNNHAVREPDALGSFLRDQGVMLRRSRKDVKHELPPLTRVPVELEIDLYGNRALAPEVAEATELASKLVHLRQRDIDEAIDMARGDALVMGGRLAAILRHATGVAKAPQVAAYARMVIESSGKTILAGWHHDVYSIWRTLLERYKPVSYTGGETSTQKSAAYEAFVHGDAQVLIMSLRSGAGLDGLQHVCSNLIIGELDWSSAVHEQIEGRIDRPEQTTPVVAHYLIGSDGSDPTIVEALGIKHGQLHGVVGERSDPVTQEASRAQRLAEAWLARQDRRAS